MFYEARTGDYPEEKSDLITRANQAVERIKYLEVELEKCEAQRDRAWRDAELLRQAISIVKK